MSDEQQQEEDLREHPTYLALGQTFMEQRSFCGLGRTEDSWLLFTNDQSVIWTWSKHIKEELKIDDVLVIFDEDMEEME
jgi:hypothetical protein